MKRDYNVKIENGTCSLLSKDFRTIEEAKNWYIDNFKYIRGLKAYLTYYHYTSAYTSVYECIEELTESIFEDNEFDRVKRMTYEEFEDYRESIKAIGIEDRFNDNIEDVCKWLKEDYSEVVEYLKEN